MRRSEPGDHKMWGRTLRTVAGEQVSGKGGRGAGRRALVALMRASSLLPPPGLAVFGQLDGYSLARVSGRQGTGM